MITLNTVIYEDNFRKVLSDTSWFITFTDTLITKKLLTVNNLNSIEELNNLLKRHPQIDIVFVDNIKDSVKSKYFLNINETVKGYYYTIPYFAAIEATKTEFLLTVATDCMDDINVSHEFLIDSIEEIDNNPLCASTMIAWTKNNYIMSNNKRIGEHEESETFIKLGNENMISIKFNYRANFTDQFFMASVDKLKKIDYHIAEDYANKIYNGPEYGGHSFEKRMVGHQVKNKLYNCVYKGSDYYIHDGRYY